MALSLLNSVSSIVLLESLGLKSVRTIVQMNVKKMANILPVHPSTGYAFNPINESLMPIKGVLKTGSWLSGQPINFHLENQGIGSYLYTLNVTDIAGNMASSSVSVNVIDTIAPAILSSGDISLSEGSKGQIISWNLNDFDPNT